MSEFKGTKGKWEIDGEQLVTITEDGQSDETIADFYPNTEYPTVWERSIKEAQANLLLCSKAPEMLEMLKDLINHYQDVLNGDFSPMALRSDIDSAIELTKQATEI